MLPMLAIVLMLNGVQVELPGPAYLIGEYSYLPARAVLQKLGHEVTWDATRQQARVRARSGPAAVLQVGQPLLVWEEEARAPVHLPVAPRIVGGSLYLPTRAVLALTGGRATWDPATYTVHLSVAPAAPEADAVSIGSILSEPPVWAGQAVTLRGEYTGWQPDPFGPATRQGPPVTRSDWSLRGEGGSLYCSGGPQNPDAPRLVPLESRGRRIEVLGVVMLADQGFPYVQVAEVRALAGLAGATCYLTSDRYRYQPGDTASVELLVGNPTEDPITLGFTSGQTYDFWVRDAEGHVVWQWSEGRMFTMALHERILQPGEEYRVTEAWTLPADLPPGYYQMEAQVNPEVQSYVRTVLVEAGGAGQ